MEAEKISRVYDRYMTPADVWGMAFGCMVGWGAFVMPGTTFLPLAGPAGVMIAMAVGTALMLLIGANFSFLMVHEPGPGGIYLYTKSAFGRDHAFLSSWFLCLSYMAIVFLNATALFIVPRILFGSMLQTGHHYVIAGNKVYLAEVALSVAALAAVGFMFIKAKVFLQRTLTVLAVVLFAGVFAVSAACLPGALAGGGLTSFGFGTSGRLFAVFSIVILAPWAFVGFEVVSFDTVHFTFSPGRAKWLIAFSIITAGFTYAVLNVVAVSALPDGYESWQSYIAAAGSLEGINAVPVFYAANSVMGRAGLAVIAAAAAAAILTGMIGAYRALIRLLSTMAEDNILSHRFLNTKTCIIFVMVISIVISFFGRNALSWFVDVTSFGAVVGYGYVSAAARRIAKAKNNRKIYITATAATLISAAFAAVLLVPDLTVMEAMSAESLMLLSLWCLLGFVFYWRTVKYSSSTEFGGVSASGVVLFALLLYSSMMWFAKTMMPAKSIGEMHHVLINHGCVLMLIIFAGLIIMIYVQDMVRKRHEALQLEKIRAVEGSRAKSQFLFNMSHDIRTPMNAIIGYTNLTMKEEISPTAKKYLGKINTSSQHLLSLINDILEMSRIENKKLELENAPEDLCLIIEEIGDLFSQQMKQKEILFSVDDSDVSNRYVWCDRKNLTRVIMNLTGNAYKFTPEGGKISLTLRQTGTGENGLGLYEICVRDSGIGMSKEFADKMFTAFERERTSTVSKTEGTGLGLAITKGIIDMMGGSIETVTAPGKGTEIIIRIKFGFADPAEIAPKAEDAEALPQGADIDFSKMRLLLAEDNDINREIAVMILTQAGFTVETACNGKEALDMVSSSAPGRYDAVLMDVQMPVMNGYEATKAIRSLENRELAEIPILAMTANAFKEDELAANEAGMQAHIAKPIDVDKMMATLREVLSRTRS